MMGWFVAVWLLAGIFGAELGLRYDLALGTEIKPGNIWVALLGPVTLAITVYLTVFCKSLPGYRR